MHWQQVTLIILWAIGGSLHLFNHGESKGEYNFGYWLISFAISFTIIYTGGFFNER
jgi:hypothetical protein